MPRPGCFYAAVIVSLNLLLLFFATYERSSVCSWNEQLPPDQTDELQPKASPVIPPPNPSTVAVTDPSPTASAVTLPLPFEYLHAQEESAWCAEHFGTKYLHNLRDNATNYCSDESASSLTCFRTQTREDGRVDSFCLAGQTIFEPREALWKLDCQLREWAPQDVVHGTPRLEDFPEYWAETGPRRVLAEYLRMGRNMKVQLARAARPKDFTILVKREENVTNFWHALMEIMSLSMMLDTLRMSRNPETDLPFYS